MQAIVVVVVAVFFCARPGSPFQLYCRDLPNDWFFESGPEKTCFPRHPADCIKYQRFLTPAIKGWAQRLAGLTMS